MIAPNDRAYGASGARGVFSISAPFGRRVERIERTKVAVGEAAGSVRRIHDVALSVTVRQSQSVSHLMGRRE